MGNWQKTCCRLDEYDGYLNIVLYMTIISWLATMSSILKMLDIGEWFLMTIS